MKIYLAARYSRIDELNRYANDLRAMGHIITSRWLQGAHQIGDDGLSEEASRAERERFAMEDWADLMAADCCISFTEPPRSSNSRGGRHVEFGAAVAAGNRGVHQPPDRPIRNADQQPAANNAQTGEPAALHQPIAERDRRARHGAATCDSIEHQRGSYRRASSPGRR